MNYNRRKTSNLRKGRISQSGATYFITICSHSKTHGLTDLDSGNIIKKCISGVQNNNDFILYCATIMPDHIHLLFQLGDQLKLGQVIAKLKSQTRHSLIENNIQWQSNFLDHHLRDGLQLERFAYYIFMNPYKKNLISIDKKWKWWIKNENYNPEFHEKLREGLIPQPEWLGKIESLDKLLRHRASSSPTMEE